jgi:ribonuclease D
MTKQALPLAVYIDTDETFKQLVGQLATESLLAIDTESNSLHAYQERVCLIQLSTRTQDYILDPLKIRDMQPLATLVADARIEKVFHAAEYDLMCLKRDFGYTFVNLFDTMVAARICGVKAIGLGALLGSHFGVKLDKSHQRDDWGRRPLSSASLSYAQMDTHYLPQLRDYFSQELTKLKHLPEAQEAFEELARVSAATSRRFDPEGFWTIGFPAELTRREMSILRELYILREDIAQERNCPPFKVFTNPVLVAIAQQEPQNLYYLRQVQGLSPTFVRRYGERILRAIEAGRSNRLPAPPQHHRPDPVLAERYAVLHQWRKARAERRGVESDVIISKQTLWELARIAPKTIVEMAAIQGLGPWRLETYGAELLDVIARFLSDGG